MARKKLTDKYSWLNYGDQDDRRDMVRRYVDDVMEQEWEEWRETRFISAVCKTKVDRACIDEFVISGLAGMSWNGNFFTHNDERATFLRKLF